MLRRKGEIPIAKVTEPGAPQVGDWVAVKPSEGKRPHRGVHPPAIRLRGLGTCEANAAASYLLQEISAERALSTHTPLRCTVAKDSATTNPVLLPCETETPESVHLKWATGSHRVHLNLEDVLRAMEKPVRVARGTTAKIPVEIVRQAATNLPGLMLHLEGLSLHAITKRGARTLPGAKHAAAQANARLARLEAAAAAEGAVAAASAPDPDKPQG